MQIGVALATTPTLTSEASELDLRSTKTTDRLI